MAKGAIVEQQKRHPWHWQSPDDNPLKCDAFVLNVLPFELRGWHEQDKRVDATHLLHWRDKETSEHLAAPICKTHAKEFNETPADDDNPKMLAFREVTKDGVVLTYNFNTPDVANNPGRRLYAAALDIRLAGEDDEE